VVAVLERYGEATLVEMRERLQETRQRRRGNGQLRSLRSNAVASGALVRSLRYEVQPADGASFQVTFLMADHGVYVDGGTRPSDKKPSRAMVQSIREWARVRGLPERIAWPAAYNILRYGQAARPFFGVSVEDGREAMVEELGAAYALAVSEWLAKSLLPGR
jgi:hypothetical protein